MKIKILAFGIVKDIINGSFLELKIPEGATVGQLQQLLFERYPAFGGLNTLAIAVNNEYAGSDVIIKESDEIVLIPPVSGG